MENFKIYDEIGRGKHSFVYKARRKRSITYVAVKSTMKTRMHKILNEVQILHQIQSPYVMKFYNWYESQNHIWLILEYCIGGDLQSLLSQDKGLAEDVIRAFGHDIMAGLQHLHGNGILHCDLKPASILLDEHGSLKLADFGLARWVLTKSKNDAKKLAAGTINYMAPELFLPRPVHSFASDFWAFGCLLYELYTGIPLFTHADTSNIITMIQTLSITDVLNARNLPKSLCCLIESLLTRDPGQRIVWDALIQHPYWNSLPKLEPVQMPREEIFEHYISTYHGSDQEQTCGKDLSDHVNKVFNRGDDQSKGVAFQKCFQSVTSVLVEPYDTITSRDSIALANLMCKRRTTIELTLNKECPFDEDTISKVEVSRQSVPCRDVSRDSAQSPLQITSINSRTIPCSQYVRKQDSADTMYPERTSFKLSLPRPSPSSQLIWLPAIDNRVKPSAYFCDKILQESELVDQQNAHARSLPMSILGFGIDNTSFYTLGKDKSLRPGELLNLSTTSLESHLRELYQHLKDVQRSSDVSKKREVLSYILTISFHAKLANVLVNSSMLIQLIHILECGTSNLSVKNNRISDFKQDRLVGVTGVCLILATLFRFASFMHLPCPEDLQKLLQILLEVVRSTDEQYSAEVKFYDANITTDSSSFRAVAAATLGEFIYFTAMQGKHKELAQRALQEIWSSCLKRDGCTNTLCISSVATDSRILRATCNVLANCQDHVILAQILSRDVVTCCMRSLISLEKLSARTSGTSASSTHVQSLITHILSHILRHICYNSMLWTSVELEILKLTLVMTILKPKNVRVLWRHMITAEARGSRNGIQVLDEDELVIAVLNSFSLLMEITSVSISTISKIHKQSPNMSDTKLASISNDTEAIQDRFKAGQRILLDKIVSVACLLNLSARYLIHFVGDSCGNNERHNIEHDYKLAGQAKIYVFLGIGMQLSQNFQLLCIKSNLVAQMDATLARFIAIRPGIFSEGAHSTTMSDITDKEQSKSGMAAPEAYLLESVLRLISITMRSCIKQCAMTLRKQAHFEGNDEQISVVVTTLESLTSLFTSETCRTQCMHSLQRRGGSEAIILTKCIIKMISIISVGKGIRDGFDKISTCLSALLDRLFPDKRAVLFWYRFHPSLSIIRFQYALCCFMRIVKHKSKSSNNGQNPHLNCLKILHLLISATTGNTSHQSVLHNRRSGQLEDSSSLDAITNQDFVVASLISDAEDAGKSAEDYNVWNSIMNVVFLIVQRDTDIITACLNGKKKYDLVGFIINSVAVPAKSGFASLPHCATQLLHRLIDHCVRSKNFSGTWLAKLYHDYNMTRSITASIIFCAETSQYLCLHDLLASTVAILQSNAYYEHLGKENLLGSSRLVLPTNDLVPCISILMSFCNVSRVIKRVAAPEDGFDVNKDETIQRVVEYASQILTICSETLPELLYEALEYSTKECGKSSMLIALEQNLSLLVVGSDMIISARPISDKLPENIALQAACVLRLLLILHNCIQYERAHSDKIAHYKTSFIIWLKEHKNVQEMLDVISSSKLSADQVIQSKYRGRFLRSTLLCDADIMLVFCQLTEMAQGILQLINLDGQKF